MANTLLDSSLISNEFLAEFIVSSVFIHMANRGMKSDFMNPMYKPGLTVSIRRQNRFTVGNGTSATVQGILDAVDPLTISNLWNTLVEVNSFEETLQLVDLQEQYIRPATLAMVAQMNAKIIADALTQITYAEGSATQPLNSFAYIRNAKALMNKLNMPKTDRYLVFASESASQIESALYNTFNQDFNRDIILDGDMGKLAGFRCFEDEQLFAHVAGTAVTVTLAANVTSGANTLSVTGTNTQTIKAGDVLTFTGINSVSPVAHEDIGELFTFTATADLTLTGGADTLAVSPSMIWDPTNPRQTLSTQPLSGNVVTNLGNYIPNLAFDKTALDLVCPPLVPLKTVDCNVATDAKYNVSVRASAQGDIQAGADYFRLDILQGHKWHYEYGLKLLSQP